MKSKTKKADPQILITCEHAGNEVPAKLQKLVHIQKQVLRSHRAYDIGAYDVAQVMKKPLKAKLLATHTSRLIVDTNRNIQKSRVFSIFTQALSEETKTYILRHHYLPHRTRVLDLVKTSKTQKKPLLVIALHSFTPVYQGKRRSTDIGILFRTHIEKERRLAQRLKKEIVKLAPDLRVHFNRPYRGFTDCLLNDAMDPNIKNPHINGIFIEINGLLVKTSKQTQKMGQLLSQAFMNTKQ